LVSFSHIIAAGQREIYPKKLPIYGTWKQLTRLPVLSPLEQQTWCIMLQLPEFDALYLVILLTF
jgi:hypothetical protein